MHFKPSSNKNISLCVKLIFCLYSVYLTDITRPHLRPPVAQSLRCQVQTLGRGQERRMSPVTMRRRTQHCSPKWTHQPSNFVSPPPPPPPPALLKPPLDTGFTTGLATQRHTREGQTMFHPPPSPFVLLPSESGTLSSKPVAVVYEQTALKPTQRTQSEL